jgi:hypothetical protein
MNYFIALFFFFAIFPAIGEDNKEENFTLDGEQVVFELNYFPHFPEVTFTNITLNKEYQLPQVHFEGQYLFFEYEGRIIGDFIHQAEVKLAPIYGIHLGFNLDNKNPVLSLSHKSAPNLKIFYKKEHGNSRLSAEPVFGISYSF